MTEFYFLGVVSRCQKVVNERYKLRDLKLYFHCFEKANAVLRVYQKVITYQTDSTMVFE